MTIFTPISSFHLSPAQASVLKANSRAFPVCAISTSSLSNAPSGVCLGDSAHVTLFRMEKRHGSCLMRPQVAISTSSQGHKYHHPTSYSTTNPNTSKTPTNPPTPSLKRTQITPKQTNTNSNQTQLNPNQLSLKPNQLETKPIKKTKQNKTTLLPFSPSPPSKPSSHPLHAPSRLPPRSTRPSPRLRSLGGPLGVLGRFEVPSGGLAAWELKETTWALSSRIFELFICYKEIFRQNDEPSLVFAT